MNKDNKIFIYMGAAFAFLIFISIVLAFSVYSGKSGEVQNVSSEQAGITPIQTPFENQTQAQVAEINHQNQVEQNTENNISGSISPSTNPQTSPVNSQSPATSIDKATEEKFVYAMLAVRNKDFDTAEKTFKELTDRSENDQWKQQSQVMLDNMDKIRVGDFSGLKQYTQNNAMARQVQACLANYYSETDQPPKFNNLDELKNFMVTNCGMQKEATDEITNATMIDSSPNYKLNITFKDRKNYQYTPTGFNELTN